MTTPQLLQRVTFHKFSARPLAELIGIPSDQLPKQLVYIQSYLAKLQCACVLAESHYIDRDHMEDHSVFYSRNLVPLPNYCRRLHFFSTSLRDTQNLLRQLLSRQRELNQDKFSALCIEKSRDSYLGFSVIRPLPGSPIGRTVLACYGPTTSDGADRRF